MSIISFFVGILIMAFVAKWLFVGIAIFAAMYILIRAVERMIESGRE